MRGIYRKFLIEMTGSIIASAISSFSVIICAFVGKNESADKVITILFPIVFWVCFLAEQFFIWNANSIRKRLENEGKISRVYGRLGILSVLQTREGTIADMILILSLIIFVALLLLGIGEEFIQYLFIFFIVLSFRMHCILNGKNFRYKQYLSKRKVD